MDFEILEQINNVFIIKSVGKRKYITNSKVNKDKLAQLQKYLGKDYLSSAQGLGTMLGKKNFGSLAGRTCDIKALSIEELETLHIFMVYNNIVGFANGLKFNSSVSRHGFEDLISNGNRFRPRVFDADLYRPGIILLDKAKVEESLEINDGLFDSRKNARGVKAIRQREYLHLPLEYGCHDFTQLEAAPDFMLFGSPYTNSRRLAEKKNHRLPKKYIDSLSERFPNSLICVIDDDDYKFHLNDGSNRAHYFTNEREEKCVNSQEGEFTGIELLTYEIFTKLKDAQ